MGARFQTTRWSLVRAAGESSADADEALAWLCETYWYPLYAFVRRQGVDAEGARDMVQSYFVQLLDKGYLHGLAPEAGKFRSFLLASLRFFMSNERTRVNAIKRSTDRPSLRVPLDCAEERYLREPRDLGDPELLYDRRWALTVLDQALRRLGEEQSARNKADQYELLRPFMTGDGPGRPYAEIAAELGISVGGIKAAVHRLRQRLGELLREEVAQTVSEQQDVDAELRYLLDVVAR